MKKTYNGEELAKTMIPLQRRAGTFTFTTNGGEVFDNPVQREEMRLIMESLIVIQGMPITSIDQVHLMAICEQFRPLQAGESVPAYVPMFECDEEGNRLSVVWEETENFLKPKEKVN